MKEIIAIIRPRQVARTKEALVALGLPSLTALSVVGRGKQCGIAGEIACELPRERLEPPVHGGAKYVPKRLLMIVVEDAEVEAVVAAVLEVNRTEQIGDGRVFVSPVEQVVRVRTGETGPQAVR